MQADVGVSTSDISSPYAMQCEAIRVSYEMMNVGGAADSIVHYGEQANHVFGASFPTNDGFQSAVSLPGNGVGDFATHGDFISKRGTNKGGLEDDKKELEGGGEIKDP